MIGRFLACGSALVLTVAALSAIAARDNSQNANAVDDATMVVADVGAWYTNWATTQTWLLASHLSTVSGLTKLIGR